MNQSAVLPETLKDLSIPQVDRGRIRVLHVIGTLDRGGIETWLVNALTHRQSDALEWSVCTYRSPDGHYRNTLRHEGITTAHIPLDNTAYGLMRFAYSFTRYLRRERFGIVHCHGGPLVGLMMALTRLAGVPVRIAHCHSARPFWGNRLRARMAIGVGKSLINLFASQGLACSREAADYMFRSGWNTCASRHVLYYGLDLSQFSESLGRDETRAALGISPAAKVLGHVGRFDPQKNHLFLVNVFAEICKRLPEALLCLVGEGRLRESVENQARVLKLQNRIVFTGAIDDVPRTLLSVFDAFAMPSLHEGLPVALLEAQAAGLRCVISDQISRETIVNPNRVTPLSLQDPDAWVDALVKTLTLPRAESGVVAMTDGRFDIKTSVASLEALYLGSSKGEPNERKRVSVSASTLWSANTSCRNDCHREDK